MACLQWAAQQQKKRYFLKWNVRGGRRRETRKWKNLRVMRKNLINISIENNNNNSQPLTLTAICSKCSKTMQKKERFSRAWITLSKQINGDADLRINYELSCLLRNAIKHLNLWWHSLWLSAEREASSGIYSRWNCFKAFSAVSRLKGTRRNGKIL